MFLRSYKRKKNGKWHEYFSIVENRRVANGGTVQRTVLYLGEITSSQENAWQKTLKVFDADSGRQEQKLLFANQWSNDCNSPDWWYGCDFDKSGVVDITDLLEFATHWLEGI